MRSGLGTFRERERKRKRKREKERERKEGEEEKEGYFVMYISSITKMRMIMSATSCTLKQAGEGGRERMRKRRSMRMSVKMRQHLTASRGRSGGVRRFRVSCVATPVPPSSPSTGKSGNYNNHNRKGALSSSVSATSTVPSSVLQLGKENSVVQLYRTSVLYESKQRKLLNALNDKLGSKAGFGDDGNNILNDQNSETDTTSGDYGERGDKSGRAAFDYHKTSTRVIQVFVETCFNIQIREQLNAEESEKLVWLLQETFETSRLKTSSVFPAEPEPSTLRDFPAIDAEYSKVSHVIEVGPRMSFSTAWSTNALAICRACGITAEKVERIERSTRYGLVFDKENYSPSLQERKKIESEV